MDTDFTNFTHFISEEGSMRNQVESTISTDLKYPVISNRLIQCLERDYPDKLPRKYQDSFELGILIGQQMIIDKLKCEKNFNEKDSLDEPD